ncbi:MAG: type II secretion system protein GspM [Bryobacteraceae bacterium]
MQDRDKRALMMLAAAVVLALGIRWWTSDDAADAVVTPAASSIPVAERRVQKLREILATAPGKRKVLEGIETQLKDREKGMIVAETAAQAQAQLLQVVRNLARRQAPPVVVSQNDLGPIQPLGDAYGEAQVSVTMNCRIEQLVNLLADITAQPELIATHELRVSPTGDQKQKMLSVRLTVSGVIPKKLVPERKGVGL